MNPLQGELHVQDSKVLGLSLQLRCIGRGIDALTVIDVDVDNIITGKVVPLPLGVAAAAGDYGTAVNIDEHGKINSLLRGPNVEAETILALVGDCCARHCLGTGWTISSGLEVILGERADGLRSLLAVLAGSGLGKGDA